MLELLLSKEADIHVKDMNYKNRKVSFSLRQFKINKGNQLRTIRHPFILH